MGLTVGKTTKRHGMCCHDQLHRGYKTERYCGYGFPYVVDFYLKPQLTARKDGHLWLCSSLVERICGTNTYKDGFDPPHRRQQNKGVSYEYYCKNQRLDERS